MSSERNERQPIYFLRTNPKGWKNNSLANLRANSSNIWREAQESSAIVTDATWQERQEILNPYAKSYIAKQWLERTGIDDVQNIRLSLIVPIHNEENSLPSMLGTLMMAGMPSNANITIIFITNGCTDGGNSELIVENFLRGLGNVETLQIPHKVYSEMPDPAINALYSQVKVDNLQFIHVNTPTPGKANALNIGNALAKDHSPIAINIDANSFVEPDAILEMYATAYKAMIQDKDGTTIVRQDPYYDYQSESIRRNIRLGQFVLPIQEMTRRKENVVVGQLMAWNTSWVDSIGGFPRVITEDYGLGATAQSQGKKITLASNAHQWSYRPSKFIEVYRYLARLAQGNFQLMDAYPLLKPFVQNDWYFSKDLKDRLATMINHISEKPRKTFNLLLGAIFLEFVRSKGKSAHRKNKQQQTWEPIESTR